MQSNVIESKCHVLIPCAGSGSRFGNDVPKQFQQLGNKLVIDYSIDLFDELSSINSIWVATSSLENIPISSTSTKLNITPTGGQTRAETVLNTLRLMIEQQVSLRDWVLVHDAARPGISPEDVNRLIYEVQSQEDCIGGILALPVSDTVKKTKESSKKIESTINRESLWLAQTPQMFRLGDLKIAIENALEKGTLITDESSAMEALGYSPLVVLGSLENFKITYQQDFFMMKKMIAQEMNIRVGQGYDVHRLVPNRPLILGGIEIPYHLGLLGHSDADALLHAITDALLGASGLGDIGQHFPDNDERYRNIDSKLILQDTYKLISQKGFMIVNIDATVICQSPKLAKYLPDMISTISKLVALDPQRINIKAKTNEGLGYLGNSEAIETQVVVLLQSV